MSSPCPSWPFPVSRTTIETLVNPLEVSRVNGSSSHRSIRTGNSATREYVAVGAGVVERRLGHGETPSRFRRVVARAPGTPRATARGLSCAPGPQVRSAVSVARVETRRALLLIADIGGYTEYMQFHRTLLGHAEAATRRLLEKVVDAAPDFDLVEIEGDAAFLSREADTVDDGAALAAVTDAVVTMHRAFHVERRLVELNLCPCDSCTQTSDLKLKFVAHVGEVAIQKIKRRRKLIGMDVIFVHRLLKNPVQVPETSFSPRISTGAAARLRPTIWYTRSRRTSRASDPCAPTSWMSRTSQGHSLRCRIPPGPGASARRLPSSAGACAARSACDAHRVPLPLTRAPRWSAGRAGRGRRSSDHRS